MGSWGEQISDSDCPAESSARFPSIVVVCVCIRSRADGEDGNGNGNGVGDCDHCTYTSRLATSTSASKLPQT